MTGSSGTGSTRTGSSGTRSSEALPVIVSPLLGFPEVGAGDDIANLILTALQHQEIRLLDGDILVVSSKVVSKAMGLRALASDQADVVLSQTVRIVAERMTATGVTRIVVSTTGPVMTAGGVDASNTADASTVLVLPKEPDAVAAQIRSEVQAGWLKRSGTHALAGVILSDTAGRPWRHGQTDFALGASGIRVIDDLRGSVDANGQILSVTERCIADELAAAADLVKGKTSGVPAAHIRGLGQYVEDGSPSEESTPGQSTPGQSAAGAKDLVRTGPQDWFGYGRVEAVRAALGVEPGSAAASEVGIPSLFTEDVATRAHRALRVALLNSPGSAATVHGDTIALLAPDEFTLGVAATRAQVALHGEGLSTTLTRAQATSVVTNGCLTAHPTVLLVLQQHNE